MYTLFLCWNSLSTNKGSKLWGNFNQLSTIVVFDIAMGNLLVKHGQNFFNVSHDSECWNVQAHSKR